MAPIICFAVLDVIMLFVIVFSIFVAANEDKYPKLAEKWLGKKRKSRKKTQIKTAPAQGERVYIFIQL